MLSKSLDSFPMKSCSTFEDSIDMPKFLGHGSDTMLDEHESPQLYDIVHFEHKLSGLLGFWVSPWR